MEMRCVVFVCLTPMCITLLVQVFSVFLGTYFPGVCMNVCACMVVYMQCLGEVHVCGTGGQCAGAAMCARCGCVQMCPIWGTAGRSWKHCTPDVVGQEFSKCGPCTSISINGNLAEMQNIVSTQAH